MVRKFVTLLLFMASLPSLAEVITQVDRTRLFDDETLNLTVRVAPISQLEQTDLDALQSLFTIEQQYRQERRQITNGQSISFVDYRFRLRPLQPGAVTIPSFKVGNAQSEPILIRVEDAAQRQDSLTDEDIRLTAQLDQSELYVDQSIRLTLELIYNIEFRNGEITPFDPENFRTELLDESRTTRNIDGQTYNVFRRVIQLTARQPGLYTLPNIRFTAEYPNRNLGRYQRFSRDVDPGSIQVRAIPDAYPDNAYWLPLSSLRLSDNLQAETELEQGDHLDWQLQLVAEGLAPENLPPILQQIEDQLPAELTLYRNPPEIDNDRRRETLALSFSAPGEYTLPDIRIPWWNLEQDRLEWATLPARLFRVSAGATQPAWPADNPEVNTATADTTPSDTPSQVWIWLTLFSSVGWLITLLVWWHTTTRSKRMRPNERGQRQVTPVVETSTEQYQTYLRLQRATTKPVTLELEAQEIIRQLEAYVLFANGTPPKEKDVQRVLDRLSDAAQPQRTTAQHPFTLYPSSD